MHCRVAKLDDVSSIVHFSQKSPSCGTRVMVRVGVMVRVRIKGQCFRTGSVLVYRVRF